MALTLAAAAMVPETIKGLVAPPVIGFRLSTVADSGLVWFLNGSAFGLALTIVFAVAGLPKRPLPLALPWADSPSGPRVLRVGGAVIALAGLVAFPLVGEVLPAATCLVVGLLLYLAGLLRRGEQVAVSSPAAVLRSFGSGLLRGFGVCLLIGVSAAAVVGGVVSVFAVCKVHSASRPVEGEVIGGWRLEETDDGDRSVRHPGPYAFELLKRPGLDRPLAVKKGVWFPYDWPERLSFNQEVRIHREGGGWKLLAEGLPRADAHNVVLALPNRVQLWLAYRPAAVIVLDTMAVPVGIGVLIGAIV